MILTARRRVVAATAAVSAAALLAVSSPAAVAQSGGYSDVPEDAYYTTPVTDLEALGVFAGTGCDEGFCPGEAIDRKTMAVWMVRILDGQDPPAVTQSRFNDVDAGSFHAPFIERMAELEVSKGCGDGSGFCPDRVVTRAQMAVFLSRAYKLPDGPDPGFSDVRADAWYAADVAKLAASGITVGCRDGAFCPGRDTERRQMATFLWRAENPGWQTGTTNNPEPSTFELNPAMEGGGIVSTQYLHSCGLRSDNTIECWGVSGEGGQTDAPAGSFKAVTVGEEHSCGIRTDGTITCWGIGYSGGLSSPAGTFTAVSIGADHACGIRTDHTIECWGNFGEKEVIIPSGSFAAVDSGPWYGCGIRTGGTIECWGWSDEGGQTDATAGSFKSVSTGGNYVCGLRTDSTLTCWANWMERTDTPTGTFKSVAAGGWHACGIHTDDIIECWGSNDRGQSEAPAGAFAAVSAGRLQSCGLRTDGTIECWGWNVYGQSEAPSGRFGPS